MALLIKGRYSDYKKGTFVLNMANVATIDYNRGESEISYDLSRGQVQGSYSYKLVRVRSAEIAQALYDDLCEWLATHTDGLFDLASMADQMEADAFAKWKAEQDAKAKES